MNGWEIAILIVVCLAFAAAVDVIIINKLKGKSGCDCGGSCASCGGCAMSRKTDVKNNDKESNQEKKLGV